jgi:hypothetical protein
MEQQNPENRRLVKLTLLLLLRAASAPPSRATHTAAINGAGK